MNVCLYIPMFISLRKFLQINKKCLETVHMLKVNPFFNADTSLLLFCEYFTPTTINLNDIKMFDKTLFSKVECLKNPDFNGLINEHGNEIKQILNKIKTFELYNRNEQTYFFIEYATMFKDIQRIDGSFSEVICFMKNYSEGGKIKNVSFPRIIVIDRYDDDESVTFTRKTIQKAKELELYIPNFCETKVYICFSNHATDQQKGMLLQLKNFHYYYDNISNGKCDLLSYNFLLTNMNLNVVGIYIPNKINTLLNKIYCNKCNVYEAQHFCKDNDIWKLPSFINTCNISYSDYELKGGFQNNNIFLCDMSNIIKLTISNCTNMWLCHEFKSLKQLTIKNCNSILFKTQENGIFNYSLAILECIYIGNSKHIEINLVKESLKHLTIIKCSQLSIKGYINCVDIIHLERVNNCSLPTISFERKQVCIEDSIELNISKSPMEFMDVSLSEFYNLAKSYIGLPSPRDYKDLNLFVVRNFTTTSDDIEITQNTLRNTKGILDHLIYLISNNFYSDDNPTQLQICSNGKFIKLKAIIHYFEVEIDGYCEMAIGLLDCKNNEIMNDLVESRERLTNFVGWDYNTIGFHSDDGNLYYSGKHKSYGHRYNEENKKRVIGCGFNTKTKKSFFVENGCKLESFEVSWSNISASITVSYFTRMHINYGESPFVFDLEKEIKQFS
ncbi:B30.2/SPRY domain-containing protein [Entamoeba marina]